MLEFLQSYICSLTLKFNFDQDNRINAMPKQNIGVLKKKSIILLNRLCRTHHLLHINTVKHWFWHCCFLPTILWLLFPECILFPHEYNISFAAPSRPTWSNLSFDFWRESCRVTMLFWRVASWASSFHDTFLHPAPVSHSQLSGRSSGSRAASTPT